MHQDHLQDSDQAGALLSSAAAGLALAELLPDEGRTAEQWATWLQNNRNMSRAAAYRVPHVRAMYRREDLEAYAAWERSRQQGSLKLSPRVAEALRAFGAGEPDATPQGRRLKSFSANVAVSNEDAAPIVQLVMSNPLTVWRLTPSQAVTYGAELLEAGQAAQRIAQTAAKPTVNVAAGAVMIRKSAN